MPSEGETVFSRTRLQGGEKIPGKESGFFCTGRRWIAPVRGGGEQEKNLRFRRIFAAVLLDFIRLIFYNKTELNGTEE